MTSTSTRVTNSQMLTHLEINGYRGLNQFCLADTGRVNLLVGRNDSGKTSVLESVRLLLSGDPRHLRRLSRSRFERRSPDIENSYRAAFYQSRNGPKLSVIGTIGEVRITSEAFVSEIRGKESSSSEFEFDAEEDFSESVNSLLQPDREIVVRVSTSGGAVATIQQPLQGRDALLSRARRLFSGSAFPKLPKLVWLGTNRAEIWAHARRYSDLYRTGGETLLLEILRGIEPRLNALVVLTGRDESTAAPAVLEVDLGLPRLLPLESMGDGFGSIISILSAIGSAENGLCLIDEVENGVHYSLLTQIWRSVLAGAHRYNTQVWATTHSYDCINAIYEAFMEAPEALRIHRLDRAEDGVVTAHTFDHAMLGRALERGLEVR